MKFGRDPDSQADRARAWKEPGGGKGCRVPEVLSLISIGNVFKGQDSASQKPSV